MSITLINTGIGTLDVNYQINDSLESIRQIIVTHLTGHGHEIITQSLSTSDVFRTLQYGGTTGNAEHYDFFEIDYGIPNVICLRSYRSWSGSSGIKKAQNLVYSIGSSSITGTESDLGQPFKTSTGGALQVISHRGLIYIFGSIPGKNGNLCFNSGTCIAERNRVHPSDIVGSSSASVFFHCGQFLLSQGSGTVNNRWSQAEAIDKSVNPSSASGVTGSVLCHGTMEHFTILQNLSASSALTASIYAVDSFDNSSICSAIHIGVGEYPGQSTTIHMGSLQKILRKPGSAAGDTVNQIADSNGVPSASGTLQAFLSVPGGLSILR